MTLPGSAPPAPAPAHGSRPEDRPAIGWRPLLVVAAHPDDETIGAGGLLATSRSAVVVHLTDGVPRDRRFWPSQVHGSPEEYAARRRRELRRALEIAALVDPIVISLAAADQEAVDAVASLAPRLRDVLAEHRPAVVVTHPYEGGHPDHDAAALVTSAAVTLLRRDGAPAPRLVEMASYHGRGDALEVGTFLGAATREVVRRLAPEVRDAKARMLAAYVSQKEVLAPFGIDVERFRSAPRYDFSAAPCPERLLYETWQFPITGAEWRARAALAIRDLGLDHA